VRLNALWLAFAVACFATGVVAPGVASAQARTDVCQLVTPTEFARVFGERPSFTEDEYLGERAYKERAKRHIKEFAYCHYEIGNLEFVHPSSGDTARYGDIQITYDEYASVDHAKRGFVALRATAAAEQVLDSELSGVGHEAFLSSSNEDTPFSGIDGAPAPNAITARSGKFVLFVRSHVQDVTQGDVASDPTFSFVVVPVPQLSDLVETAIGRLRGTGPPIDATFDVGRGDMDLAVGDGVVWVADHEPDETDTDEPVRVEHAGLWRINIASGKAVGANRRDSFADVAVGEGAIWVTNYEANAVSRVDSANGKIVVSIDVQRPVYVAVGEGAVWIADGRDSGTVSRLDPATNAVTATLDIGTEILGLAVGAGAVWVTTGTGTVARLDPVANAVTAAVDIDIDVDFVDSADVAVGEGAIWVATGTSTMARLDPATNAVTNIEVGTRTVAVAVGAGAVWVLDGEDLTLSRLDPATYTVVGTVDISRADDIAVGEGAVWVALGGTVLRIDPAHVG